MATRGHSRFTDDVICTPAPAAPQIDVKTVDELRDTIFVLEKDEIFRNGLIAAEEFKSQDLYEKYPPKFQHKNKCLLLDLLNTETKYVPSPHKSILITRWKPFIPIVESRQSSPAQVTYQSDVFNYISTEKQQTVEWHLNFANKDLFAYYGGPLLAQDELQVLECVELAALREYFVQTINTVGSRTVGFDSNTDKSVPTPILISNTERVINLNIKDIYGNAFAKASEDQLRSAFQRVETPQLVNLIAIEAPSYGEGRYTYDQVHYILTTCYTGFKAAQILASKTHTMNTDNSHSNERSSSSSDSTNLRTVIHTGWWGCGAYGNNRQMMLITQILAAHWAQIDEIVFHTQNDEHQQDITAATEAAQKWIYAPQVKEVIEEIVNMNLEWDKSNNT